MLYPNCVSDKKVGHHSGIATMEGRERVFDKGFGKFLVMIKNMLPKDNELPESTYEAKKVVCPLGLVV